MSISELNKSKHLHNEKANNINIAPENSYLAIDMDLVKKETETPGSTAKSNDFVCIDIIENSVEHHTDTNKEVDAGTVDITDLKVHVASRAARRKSSIKEFYDSIVDFGKRQRLQRMIRRQTRTSDLPDTPGDLTKSQDPLQAQGYPPGSGYHHSQGYPQEKDQGVARLRGGVEYSPGDRSQFVVLVLSITFIMLMTTALIIGTILVVPGLKRMFMEWALLLFIPASVALIAVNCIFAYSECGRRPPVNFILLIITVMAMSCIAGAATCAYKTDIIFQAVLATAIVVGICSLIACTNIDFTGYLIYVILIALVFTVVTLVFFTVRTITGQKMTILHLIMLFVGTLIQAVVLVIELQMILGGRAIELDEEEYALGAFYLYTSIVNIFIKMLSIIGTLSEDE